MTRYLGSCKADAELGVSGLCPGGLELAMDIDPGILTKLTNALIGYLNEFAKLPPKEQVAAVLPVIKWVGGGIVAVVMAMVGVVVWLHKRSARHAIEFAKEKVGLEAKISILDKANKELAEEKARLLARCPVKVSENVEKELRDGNFERASLQASDFLKIGAPGIAIIHRHLAEEALGRIEDGEAGLEAARLHALGWLAADPQSTEARSMVDAITDRMNRTPVEDSPAVEDDYAGLIRALEQNAHDFSALYTLGERELTAGDYRVAVLVLERALRVGQKSGGTSSPEVFDCRLSAARAALWSGDVRRCEGHVALLSRQLDGSRRVSTNVKVSFAVLQVDLLLRKGQAEQALHRADKALGDLKAESPESKVNLLLFRAQCLLDQGRAAEAEAAYRALLPLHEKVRGVEHPDTLTMRFSIAECLLDQGRAAEAEAAFRALLPLHEKVQGVEHPDTLTTRIYIAKFLLNQGRAAEAEAAFRALLPLEERIMGVEHPYTLTTRLYIAQCLLAQGRAAEAEPILHAVMNQASVAYGPVNPRVGRVHHLCARALDMLGRSADAEPHLEDARRLFAPLTPEHPYRREFAAYLDARNVGDAVSAKG